MDKNVQNVYWMPMSLKKFPNGYFLSLQCGNIEWCPLHAVLNHIPLAPHLCISELGQHWFRYWLVTYLVLTYYLNQCCVIVNWTLRNELQWNFNQNTKLFIHENASENVVSKTPTILSWGDELNLSEMESAYKKHVIDPENSMPWLLQYMQVWWYKSWDTNHK